MKIIEKITETQYIGQKETGIHKGTRYMIDTNTQLNEGDIISKKNPIKGKFQTLCELCISIYVGGQYYNTEIMKRQAIDFHCGFFSREETEF